MRRLSGLCTSQGVPKEVPGEVTHDVIQQALIFWSKSLDMKASKGSLLLNNDALSTLQNVTKV